MLSLRDIRPEDKDTLVRFHARLSEETKYRRYHGFKGELTRGDLRFLTEVDGHEHVALVACGPDGEFAGIARVVSDDNFSELAIVVADDVQSGGVGRALMEGLLDRAEREGHDRIVLEVQSDNYRAVRFFQGFGARQLTTRGGVHRLVIDRSVATR